MIILISPTKTMAESLQEGYQSTHFHQVSKKIMETLTTYSVEDLMSLMKIKEPLALQNYKRFSTFAFDKNGTPAILAYQGLQYKHMNPLSFSEEEKRYAQNHVRILSGLYGVLKPYDLIYPYRLEMQTKLGVGEYSDLYSLWGPLLSEYVMKEAGDCIINLASNEYSKVLDESCKRRMVSIYFKVQKDGKLKSEATQAKMARGKMVHYLVHNKVDTLDAIKLFCDDGFYCDDILSNGNEFVFVKIKE